MSKESELLDEIFSSGKWKNKYKVKWCDSCNVAIIQCPVCKNTSCNCSSCNECHNDFTEFCDTTKHSVRDYLNENEVQTYDKILSIQKHIVKTLQASEPQIDFKKLNEQGKLSRNERKMFSDHLN